jgi:hypothetical protein
MTIFDFKNDETIYSLFQIENEVLYGTKNKVCNYNSNTKIDVSAIGNIRKGNNALAYIQNSVIDFFDAQLTKISSFKSEKINYESGLDVFSASNFVIHNFIESDNLSIVRNSKIEEEISDFWGKVINEKFIIHYNEQVFKNPKSFKLTNFLNTETYFEFKCGLGYELISEFYIWEDTLVFMYFKDLDLKLEQLDIKTGKIIWKTKIQDSSFIFDKERGLMVSIWGNSGKYSENKDQYQIIDLKTQTVEIETPQKSFDFINVESHMGSALYKNKLYFSDNPFSYANEDPNPIYIGCFDIETKKVDFIKEIPEMAGSQVAEIICNEEKLYVRSSNGDLIVYEI